MEKTWFKIRYSSEKSKEISNQSQKQSKNQNETGIDQSKNEQKMIINGSKNSEIMASNNFDAADLAFNSLIAGYGTQYTIITGYDLVPSIRSCSLMNRNH